ncbi:hypothetical protein [Actinacidiphila glaucinigra]|uniref:Acyl-CoA dehydrogenase n=1 Tax=Actinacidiphila glaucinigra TaxID=235986 RepID=A0A239F262_9ACTN|nr:hypothetical protein [Actinacidiphila glaucinigra]SNS50925.1 hypothetical protein SAMN05216252_106272 [Actinacidiphila glaucinigra]
MSALTFEEAAEYERLVEELGRFDPETAPAAGLESLGYDDDKGWFVGRRAA